MSKQSYLAGFCKAAEAKNVDPKALAEFAMQKHAEDSGKGLWDIVKEYLEKVKTNTVSGAEKVKDWYVNRAGESTKSLIGAGLGAAVGTGLGAAVTGGKKGLVPGAIIGGIGGAAAPHVNWKAVINSFKNKPKKQQSQDKGHENMA